MAINLAKVYIPICDEIYKQASLTADLDGAAELMREGYNANEMVIPMISMDGLGNYSRNSGYVKGDVSVEWQTHKCNFDRGRKFSVDDLDNVETGGVAFGKLVGEFIRTKVVPEIDAFRFATYAGTTGISTTTGAALSTGDAAIKAIRTALEKMDNDEVPLDGRILYVTYGIKGMIDDLDTTKSRAVLSRFSKIVEVPQTRFYTAIKQNDGSTEGETAGGYAKDATAGKNINFMIVHPSACIQFQKHVVPKILAPDVNPDGDAWIYGYRNVGIADTFKNKVAGIYLHKSTT